MTPGERYVVPATAERPQILTGRPNAPRVTVGTTAIPPLGPAARTISDVSLAPADLMARLQPAATPLPAPTRCRRGPYSWRTGGPPNYGGANSPRRDNHQPAS